jgi:class 3 adenylate cyclase/pimeloyl-ACP methyl ester carboxylesterase
VGQAAPDVHYATTRDGVRIAYAINGEGPALVFVRALNSHVQESWDNVRTRRHFEALGAAFTVVRFDARGNGMSGDATTIDIDTLVEDVRAVVDDLGITSVTVYGQGFGTPVAIAFAARNPDVVDRLVLYCAHARGLPIPDVFLETMRVAPRQAHAIMAHDTYPDAETISTDLIRQGLHTTSAETAVAYFELVRTVDVVGELSDVKAPTLVMQPERSPVVRTALGREIAEAIPHARFVEVPGGSYNPWAPAIVESVLQAIGDFAGVSIPLMPKARPLAVMLTDIVGSTEMTHRLGEERARDLFHAHDAIVHEAIVAHGGVEVKHTGDGTLATFEETRQAVACAVAIERRLERERTGGLELQVRIGVAYGDVVEEQGDLFGTTVMQAVRITDRTKADQIFVSEAVFEAVRDQGFAFGPARSFALKGFPERARLHEVVWAS